MVIADGPKVIRRVGHNKIVPDTGSNEYLPDAGDGTEGGEKFTLGTMARLQCPAGRATVLVPAGAGLLPQSAREPVHVGSRTSHILHDTLESLHTRHPGDLTDKRCDAPALDDPALMVGKGTERAASKTAAVAGHREPDRLKGRHVLPVGRVGLTGKRYIVDMIQFQSCQRCGRGILDDNRFWMRLHHRFSPDRILLGIV